MGKNLTVGNEQSQSLTASRASLSTDGAAARPFIRNRHVAAAEPEVLDADPRDLIGQWLVSDRFFDGQPSAYAAEHCGYELVRSGGKWAVCTDRGQYLRGLHRARLFSSPLSAAIAAEEDWENNVVCGARP